MSGSMRLVELRENEIGISWKNLGLFALSLIRLPVIIEVY
jgi:hypothetical protein